MEYITLKCASERFDVPLSTLRYNYDRGAFPEEECEVEIRGRQRMVTVSATYMKKWCSDWRQGLLPARIKQERE